MRTRSCSTIVSLRFHRLFTFRIAIKLLDQSMTESQPLESELLQLRSITVPENYHQVAYKIFDKKLRSYLSLPSKQEVLQNCQELLITKTVDYMNCINQQEKKQLASLNALNLVLTDKQTTINELKLQITQLSIETKDQQQIINNLNRDLDLAKKSLAAEQLRAVEEANKYIQVIRQQQKAINILKSEHLAVKSTLEASNKELQFALGVKTTQLKNAFVAHKEEMTIMKTQKEKDTIEFNRRFKEKVAQFQRMKQELSKDKKYLQDLIEVKEDEIKQAKKPKPRHLAWESQFSFLIKGQKEKEKQKERNPREEINNRARTKTKQTKPIFEEPTKIDIPPRRDTCYRIEQVAYERAVQRMLLKDAGAQCNLCEVKPPDAPKTQPTKQKELIDTPTQTVAEDPCRQQQEMSQLQIKLRDFMEQKYRLVYDERAKNIQIKLKEEYFGALKDAQRLMNSLKEYTNEMRQISESKVSEIEKMYQERPSRQQDLEFIQLLAKENESLVQLCLQAQKKSDCAYVALQQYHSRLQGYKKATPVNIQGRLPPQIHSQKNIKSSHISSIRNMRLHTVPSFHTYMQREKKGQTEDMSSLAKEMLVSQYETEVVLLTPMKQSRKSRPQTGVLRLRRKSFV